MRPFRIEHLAIAPADNARAKQLLARIGLQDWVQDTVHGSGVVFGVPSDNVAKLDFNYDTFPANQEKPQEFELIRYESGNNWMRKLGHVPHFGMHVTYEELPEIREIFASEGVEIAQELITTGHENPHLEGRAYHYVIYDTAAILGVALEFIIRREMGAPYPEGFPGQDPHAAA